MTDAKSSTHPAAADLQRYADGEATDGRVNAHVQSCSVCGNEVAAVRRVTAALSLGSRPPDSLTETIRAKRAASGRESPGVSLRRPPIRSRSAWLPLGLAAAAMLAIFIPRAWREQPSRERPSPPGAKGAMPMEVIEERIVTETGPTSIDSMSWEFSGRGTTAELRYIAGLAESPRAERLVARVAERLKDSGLDARAIVVRAVPAQGSDPLPPGGVGLTIRLRAP